MQCTILGHTPRLAARNLRRMVGLINRGTTELVQHFPCRGSSHRRKRTLLDINLIWFGYITRISRRGRGGCFTQMIFLPSLRLERGGGVSTLCCTRKPDQSLNPLWFVISMVLTSTRVASAWRKSDPVQGIKKKNDTSAWRWRMVWLPA